MKKLHTVRFQIYDILENSLRQWNYGVRKKKKRWVFRGRDKGWTSEHKGVLGQRKFSGWYHNDEYVPFIHFSKPTECTTPRTAIM